MRILKGEEITKIYPQLFKDIFGYWDEKQIPRTVILSDDNRGFVSGYLIDKENFYMAWGGHMDGFKAARKCWLDGEANMKEVGVKYFQTVVENTNTTWQRMLMGMGWIPYGIKATQGKLYIEYYKEL
jgi:hypothetical protein